MQSKDVEELKAHFVKHDTLPRLNIAQLIAEVERLHSSKLPEVPEMKGRIPIVVYCQTQADVDEFCTAMLEAKPNMITRQL